MSDRKRAQPWLVTGLTLLLLLGIGTAIGSFCGDVVQVAAFFAKAVTTASAEAADDDAGKDSEKKKGDEESAGDEEDADEDPLEDCDDKQAKALAAEVKKISKKKNATQVLPVLEKIEDYRHKEFEKPLLKLLKHPSSLVAIKAAEMWEWRNHKKIAKKVWGATFGDRKVNKRRFQVKALVLKSWPRAGLTISDRDLREIKSDWRWIVGNPNASLAPALTAIAEYVAIAKDKRMCRMLAEELTNPGDNVAVNAANNPPQEWHERRWKLWKETKPACVAALKALTGQEFDKTAEAKKWFKENEKTFGFEW